MRFGLPYLMILLFCCIACSHDDVAIPNKIPVPASISVPGNFPQPVYDFTQNPLTEEGIALGKMLFYDPILSRNNTISCGSCHLQPSAFTHHGHTVSHGIDDLLGRRNSLPIQNLIWYTNFFWDGGVHQLDLVALDPISNPVEMDEDVQIVLEKLRGVQKYRDQFAAAFGSEEITSTQFLQALSQFVATMVSANSRYDHYIRNEGEQLTTEELDGLAIFQEKCATCHATDLFTDQSFRNNGLSATVLTDRDGGRAEVTLREEDRGKFKVPSLRNVEYTGPYMHNGKFQTLESVLEFYATGVQISATLDPTLVNDDGTVGVPLTAEEKKKIIAFLRTLSDEQFLSDRRFSEY